MGTANQMIKAAGQIAPQSVAAAANAVSASAVDFAGFDEVLCAFNIGAFTGGVTSVACEVEGSPDGSSYSPITGGSSTTTLTAANRYHVGRVRKPKTARYLRIKMTVNGGTSCLVAGTIFGVAPQVEPVVQDFASAFEVS